MSDTQLAEYVGVDHSTVTRHRQKLESTVELQQSPTRTGRDGRTIDTTNIGRRQGEVEEERNATHGLQLSQGDKEKMAGDLYRPYAKGSAKDRAERKKHLAEILSVTLKSIQDWTTREDKDADRERG